MFCSNCGQELIDNIDKCPNCNVVIKPKDIIKQKKKSKAKLLYMIIAIALVAVSVFIVTDIFTDEIVGDWTVTKVGNMTSYTPSPNGGKAHFDKDGTFTLDLLDTNRRIGNWEKADEDETNIYYLLENINLTGLKSSFAYYVKEENVLRIVFNGTSSTLVIELEK